MAGKLRSYDCDSCVKRKLQAKRGCNGLAPKPLFYTDEFGPVRRCPVKLIPAWVHRVCDIYLQCRAPTYDLKNPNDTRKSLSGYVRTGFPEAGGYLDQSPALMKAFAILDQKINEILK